MTAFSIVIASQSAERARWTISAFEGFGEDFERLVMVGFENILDAYRAGQEKASHDLVAYVHNDVTPLSSGFGATFEELFRRESNIGFAAACGSLRPLACGCVYHDPDSAVDSIVIGRRNHEHLISGLNGGIPVFRGPRHGVVNLARPVSMVDAGLLVTKEHDWRFEPTSRENFLGAYDADISYEAVEKGRRLFVLPFPIVHWGCEDGGEPMVERDRMFLAGRTETTLERWKRFTVPCRYGGPARWCPAFVDPLTGRTAKEMEAVWRES